MRGDCRTALNDIIEAVIEAPSSSLSLLYSCCSKLAIPIPDT
jgi:hypothetical protein